MTDPVDIIYEDETIIAVNKPNNVLIHHSHFSRNIEDPSLVELLQNQLDQKFFPVHRLDYKTSGALIFCKSVEHVRDYQQLIENNVMEKKYWALVRGYTPEKLTIDSPIGPPKSDPKAPKVYRDALTYLIRLQKTELDIPLPPFDTVRYSLVELSPKTGRTHQLRKHMNKISHPVIGDHRYGDRHHNRLFEEKLGFPLLFLHAKTLQFQCPFNGSDISIEAPLPQFWHEAFKTLKMID